MQRLDAETVQFFGRLAKSPDGHALRAVLQAELRACEKGMRTLEGANMHRAQGAAILLDELIANLSGAHQQQPTSRSSSARERMHESLW